LVRAPLLGEITVQAVLGRHADCGIDPRDLLEHCRAKLAEVLASP
jgi:hypothetical protein